MNIKENKFWIFWGKLSAIIITIAAFITIYIQIFPSKSELIVEGDYYKFAIPVDLANKILLYNSITSLDSINKYVHEYDKKYRTNISNDFEFKYFLNKKLDSVFGDFKYNPNYYDGHFHFIIKNAGSKISRDISFLTPIRGIVLITRQDDSQITKEFNKQIKLNSLRPGESLSLALWTKYTYSFYEESDFRITDNDGSGRISFPTKVTGFSEFVVNNLFILIFGLIIFLILSFVILIEYCSGNKNEDKEIKTSAT